MESIRYSVVVPLYNAEVYLRECLDSVLAQTHCKWECICVDDGSKDSSRVIVEEYVAHDSRFKCIIQPHQGVGPARNAGMAAANGEYLVFLDADDTLEHDALETLEGETADVITFLTLRDGGPVGRRELDDATAYAFFDAIAGNMLAWNAAYRREHFADLRFSSLINCEDLVFAAEAYARARTMVAGVKPWYRHRNVSGSAANTHSWRRVVDTWKSLWMMRRAYRPVVKNAGLRLVLARKLTMHFILHIAAEIPRTVIASCGRMF